MKHIVGMSGGIDSQACALWVRERERSDPKRTCSTCKHVIEISEKGVDCEMYRRKVAIVYDHRLCRCNWFEKAVEQ